MEENNVQVSTLDPSLIHMVSVGQDVSWLSTGHHEGLHTGEVLVGKRKDGVVVLAGVHAWARRNHAPSYKPLFCTRALEMSSPAR